MQVLLNAVVVVQIVAALAMIGLVLIQHGKGADMGASFGSGSAGSLFGATGSANFLSRSTAVAAAIFFSCTLALAYAANLRGTATPDNGSTVLDRAATAPLAASAPSVPATGAAQIPTGAAPPAGATSAVPAAATPAVPADGAASAASAPAPGASSALAASAVLSK